MTIFASLEILSSELLNRLYKIERLYFMVLIYLLLHELAHSHIIIIIRSRVTITISIFSVDSVYVCANTFTAKNPFIYQQSIFFRTIADNHWPLKNSILFQINYTIVWRWQAMPKYSFVYDDSSTWCASIWLCECVCVSVSVCVRVSVRWKARVSS